MRLDRPSGGSDKPGEGNRPPPDSSYWSHGHWPPDFSHARENRPDGSGGKPHESGEGTGWPKDEPDAKLDKPKTREELEAENKSLRSENTRLTGDYENSLRELQRKNNELSTAKTELANTRADRSRLIDTNSELVRRNMELHKKTEYSSDLDHREKNPGAQTDQIEKDPKRKNWFPTDKMGQMGTAVAGVAGTYAVMAGRVASKEEAFGLACAGAGMTTLALGRELTDKVNAWRDRRAEKKNADRP